MFNTIDRLLVTPAVTTANALTGALRESPSHVEMIPQEADVPSRSGDAEPTKNFEFDTTVQSETKAAILPQEAPINLPWWKTVLPTALTSNLDDIKDKKLRESTRIFGALKLVGLVGIAAVAWATKNPVGVVAAPAYYGLAKIASLRGVEDAYRGQKLREAKEAHVRAGKLAQAKREREAVAARFTEKWGKVFEDFFGENWTQEFQLEPGWRGIQSLRKKDRTNWTSFWFHCYEKNYDNSGIYYKSFNALSGENEMTVFSLEKDEWILHFDRVKPIKSVKGNADLTPRQLIDFAICAVRDVYLGKNITVTVGEKSHWVDDLEEAGFTRQVFETEKADAGLVLKLKLNL